jgi:hypothetical protein
MIAAIQPVSSPLSANLRKGIQGNRTGVIPHPVIMAGMVMAFVSIYLLAE